MKFATLGHLMFKENIKQIPKDWIHDEWIYSPEIDLNNTKGYITGLTLTAEQLMNHPLEKVRKQILDLAVFLQDKLDVELIQLGGLTTSVTSGGRWLAENNEYRNYVNHGDSYTSAVACQAVSKALEFYDKKSSDLTLAIVGTYGIIGEAVSKILVPQFENSILIGRRENKLKELEKKIEGNFETTTKLQTKKADVIITATNHPTALLKSEHIKENAIVVDVSQPPNLSPEVCQKRTDICRVDGGFVDVPNGLSIQIPALPKGKIFSCVAEVIMQSIENERKSHVGSIDLNYLKETEKWGSKYRFTLNEITNFGNKIETDIWSK